MDQPASAGSDLGFVHLFEPGVGPWTLLLLHGTGGDEHDLIGLGRRLAPGAALVSPRGKVLEDGMPRFFRRLAVGRLDIPDLLERTDELADFLEAAVRAHRLDPGRVVAVGFSNGANIAVSLLLRRSGLLRGALLLRPMLPYEPELVPDLTGTDVLVATGEGDVHSPAEQTARLVEILRDAGAAVTASTEPGAGHALTAGDLARSARWLTDLMGPTA